MSAEGRSRGADSGVTFLSALALLFIGLKLTHHIDWAWSWVLAPLWAPFAAIIAVMGVYLVIASPFWIVGAVRDRRRE